MQSECTICKKPFSKQSNLKRHLENIHLIAPEPPDKRKSNGVELQFESMGDFFEWKSEMEKETLSSYTNVRQNSFEGGKYFYFECSRSGTYKPKGKGVRKIKSQNSSKIGRKCPSKINVKLTESYVYVKFYQDHEGHEKDLEHLRLPPTFRAEVADGSVSPFGFVMFLAKLKEGVSPKMVVEDARNETIFENKIGRAAFLSLKDVRNIKRDFKVGHQEQEVEIEVIDNQFQNNVSETSLVDKLHTLIELYNNTEITIEEEEDLHNLVGECIAVFNK